MSATFEDLRVLKIAEEITDSIWKRVVQWDDFAKDVVGKQLAKAADSIGANIAESFGRFHFGEKLQFLYYARGSLFETKYWLNRVRERGLMKNEEVQRYAQQLTDLAKQLNTFSKSLKTVRVAEQTNLKTLREPSAEYMAQEDFPETFFDDNDLKWLNS
ncbi:MAG: four helix bundle protein [Chloroflexi bacterium]|nr:four helix bundle protein [Chloroflexota bacterium]